MSAIGKTIWLLESRLFEETSLEEIAGHIGLSRSHISRVFPIATGYSIRGYVRARRLSEAARLLADGAPDILAVALGCGYGSHEAFTRAFRDQFGTTPEEVRRQRSTGQLQLVEPLPMSDTIETRLAAPVFEDRPLTHLAGLKRHQRMSQANLVPLQWQEFTPYLGNIPGGIGRSAYGVVGNIAQIGDDYDYYSVVEVDGRHALPSDLISLDLPAQRFARFRHEGHVSTIRSTIGAIFEKWQLHPGTTSDGSFGFIEYYGPGFDPAAGLGDIEIWIAAPK